MDAEKVKHALTEVSDLADDLKEAVPFVRALAAGYTSIRRRRIVRFLKSIHVNTRDWDPKKQRRFEKYIQSDLGIEILSDYADTVLLTNSLKAQACLALLYADFEGKYYSPSLKSHAVAALRGCSDRSLSLFVQLLTIELEVKDDPPYQVRMITDEVLSAHPELAAVAADEAALLGLVGDLTRRGLLLPDHAGNRAGATSPHWFYPIGIGFLTWEYRDIILQAEALISQSAGSE